MPQQLKVMISSTARDLPEHRKEVLDACLRQGMFPMMMEYLPASDGEAITVSLKLVDEADIYVGVFAHRYGYVPKENNPQQLSITEMEYDRAVERDIPRLIFLMDRAHPITIDAVEQGQGTTKLAAFKKRLETERVVNYFNSPADLRAHVINSLSQLRQPDLQTFHYVSAIPAPPEPFIAHPYTLLQTGRLIGRQEELSSLTDWVSKSDSEVYGARVLNFVAIGGLGKSALTWTWFKEVAPHEMKPLAGRMWWGFYESDATFENFVTRALAYVTRRSLAEVQQVPAHDRETQLLAALNHEPFLLVLDGLERELVAYARMDAARLDDSRVDSQRNLRKTADPRVGRFLKRLAQISSSRILASTRLYPADLETESGDPLPGSFRRDLTGLTDEDAVELWRAFNVSGARDLLLPIFATFGKHPLLIQALAGEVKRYRPAPGNFEEWRKANPRFDPTKLPLLQDAMSHVLEFALRGLDDKAQQVVRTIAAFRMPARYDTLAALLIGDGKPCVGERELDGVLTELEDRGLVGWDRRANRYDLHPIVRGVVWTSISNEARRGIYEMRLVHFESLLSISENRMVSLEDLTAAIELYHTLVGLERYEDAYHLFMDRLHEHMQFRLSCTCQQSELLEILFPEGVDALPCFKDQSLQASVLRVLAESYHRGGQPGRAMKLYYRSIDKITSERNLISNLEMLSNALLLSAFLRKSEEKAFEALHKSRETGDIWEEAVTLCRIGIVMAVRGIPNITQAALQRALGMFIYMEFSPRKGGVKALMAECQLWQGNYSKARLLAEQSWRLAHEKRFERDFIRSARLQGIASLGLIDLSSADEQLHHALVRARAINYIEEELPTLIGLSELRRRQGDPKTARELLDDVWEAAERGPYPLFHADAYNVLARIERDEGNEDKATEAARKAYRLAWCDGPPFAYHWGLEEAKKHLRELGAEEPEMPAFDEGKFEPMPVVEIDPEDEFHGGRVLRSDNVWARC